jgi:CRP-like cAMP-binding protein
VRRRELTRRLEALATVPPFAALPEDTKADIAERLQYAPFARGDVITKQGNKAHWLYILAYGEAEVVYEPPNGTPSPLGTVRAGEFFGEMALISGEARTATVVAKTDVECYRLDRASFQELLLGRPEISEEIKRVMGGRRGDLERVRESYAGAPPEAEAEVRLVSRIRRFFGMGA